MSNVAGVNNAYLIATHDALARTYNDTSVLENHHLAALYALLHEQPEVNVFAGLDGGQWKQVRKIIIDAILHTDMTYHFPTVSKVSLKDKQDQLIACMMWRMPMLLLRGWICFQWAYNR